MKQAQGSRKFYFVFTISVFLTLFMSITAIRIEWANAAAGGYLPRPQPPSIEGNDIPWRVSGAYITELGLRRSVAHERGFNFDEDEALFSIALSRRQLAELDQRLRRAAANNKLRDLVSTVGLLQ
ncbi:MAG: hypothetical protein AAGG38_11510 [Planctomycetota bacterium]